MQELLPKMIHKLKEIELNIVDDLSDQVIKCVYSNANLETLSLLYSRDTSSSIALETSPLSQLKTLQILKNSNFKSKIKNV